MRKATKQDHRQSVKAEINRMRKDLGLNAQDFPEWLPHVTPQWTWNWLHQQYLYAALQRVTDGTTKRHLYRMHRTRRRRCGRPRSWGDGYFV